MKFIILLQTILFTYLGIQLNMLPQLPSLLVGVVAVMVLDLVTGMVKAKLNEQIRSSKMLRETVKKFIQYFTAIAIAVGIQLLFKNIDGESVNQIKLITRALCVFIILIEVFSCCENIYEVDKTSPFSKYLITPLLKIMSLGFKNNPIIKAAEKADNGNTENDTNKNILP